ncbi:hypothetical protein Bphy_7387 (plasmid) [Paraburkholderia phymatum STM815]|uniref:Uncharacterized protein n=1 Tax=Paraburkholderia phymatum (strain DSM 17167 / CIP 108236 / LMG 21445 / STM815) TaxID=391038 RepID=B2JXK7_PARP8|nr:hypothetical protein Bphy_7387 [Paraburkholderia phymatum STM815]
MFRRDSRGLAGTLRRALCNSSSPDRTHIEAYLASCSDGGIESLEVTHLVSIKLASGAQLDLRLATLPTDDEQRKHPVIVANVSREEIIYHPGAKERLGLCWRPRLEFLIEQLARCDHKTCLPESLPKCTKRFSKNVVTNPDKLAVVTQTAAFLTNDGWQATN